MKIFIPNSAFLRNIENFLLKMDLQNEDTLELSVHPDYMAIHPLVLAMIGSLGKSVHPSKTHCDDILATSGHYLETMGLFELLGIKPKVKEIHKHELSGRCIPLTIIANSDDLDKFLTDIIPLLHLEKETRHVDGIRHIFSELIRNVLEHSESKTGAVVCAQYFKTSNKIAIGIADTGIGLKKSIGESYPVKEYRDAIKLALMPGVTGTTKKPGGTRQNAGFGLFLIKSLAHVNSDYFTIISGDKMYKLRQRGKSRILLKQDPFREKHTLRTIPYWKGVAVGVDISLSQTQEFNFILSTIRSFYTKDVKGQKKLFYKKPKFIS